MIVGARGDAAGMRDDVLGASAPTTKVLRHDLLHRAAAEVLAHLRHAP